MAFEDPPSPRSKIVESEDHLRVVIPARRNWFVILFLGFWLCGWAVGEVMVCRALFASGKPAFANLFMVVWLGFWTIGGGIALLCFHWQLAGREVIEVTRDSMLLREEIWGVGRSRLYRLEDVRDLRMAEASNSPQGSSSASHRTYDGPQHLAFDLGARTVRFAGGIDEAEAKYLLKLIKGWLGL